MWLADVEARHGSRPWLSDILTWLLGSISAGREQLSWDDATERIDEAWLRAKGFGPPSVEVRVLRGKIIGAAAADKPKPPHTKPVANASPASLKGSTAKSVPAKQASVKAAIDAL